MMQQFVSNQFFRVLQCDRNNYGLLRGEPKNGSPKVFQPTGNTAHRPAQLTCNNGTHTVQKASSAHNRIHDPAKGILASSQLPTANIHHLKMGFNSVFQSLTELFPQIDARILTTVANEHPTDPDEAVAAVLSEVVPLFPQEWEDHFKKRKLDNLPHCKVEPELQQDDSHDRSLSLSQWLHPSHLPQSYLALLNEEDDEKPPLDYTVKKVVLPSRDEARREVRTVYSASNKTGSSVVKPSIRVQSHTNLSCQGSSSKVPVSGRSSRKVAHPSSNYSEKLRSWKKRSNNNNRDFSQLHGQYKDVPSKQSNKNKCRSYATERERKQRIDDNIKALAKLLPHEVEDNRSESILNDIVDHVKLLQLQMKELSVSRLGGEPVTHPMTHIEGFGHYIHHEEMKTKSLEEMMEDLLANDPDAAASFLESKGLYLMPFSSLQGSC